MGADRNDSSLTMLDSERIAAVRRLEAVLGSDARLHLVGGALRDLWLGRPSGDWDLATALHPEVVLQRVRAQGFRGIPTGVRHGTVTIWVDNHPFEITTFRSDGPYRDGRRPAEVRLGVSLEDDLARRDFTINAMALPVAALEHPSESDWVDPFGGRRDLAEKCIRAVGDPLIRFAEDGLRPLRACRFVAQLGFRIDPETERAMALRLDVARSVAVERVRAELDKLLLGMAASKGLQALLRTGLLDLWLGELHPMVGCVQGPPHRWDVWHHSLVLLEHLPPELGLRWAGLLHDAGKPHRRAVGADGRIRFWGHELVSLEIAQTIFQRLKAPKALVARVQALIRHHGLHPDETWSSGACRRLLARLAEAGLPLVDWATFRRADRWAKGGDVSQEDARHVAMLARLEALAREAPVLNVTQLALDGRALMALADRPGGPWLGALQRHLLDWVLEDPTRNEPKALAEAARDWLVRKGGGAPEGPPLEPPSPPPVP